MAASHQLRIKLDLPEDRLILCIHESAKLLAEKHGWKIERRSEHSYAFSVGTNLLSWGEKVSMRLEDGAIVVRSECSSPLQFLDWGKNSSNTEKVNDALYQCAKNCV